MRTNKTIKKDLNTYQRIILEHLLLYYIITQKERVIMYNAVYII